MNPTVPRRGATPPRPFRIPDHEYLPAIEKSKRVKVSLTSVVRAAIREWVQR